MYGCVGVRVPCAGNEIDKDKIRTSRKEILRCVEHGVLNNEIWRDSETFGERKITLYRPTKRKNAITEQCEMEGIIEKTLTQ